MKNINVFRKFHCIDVFRIRSRVPVDADNVIVANFEVRSFHLLNPEICCGVGPTMDDNFQRIVGIEIRFLQAQLTCSQLISFVRRVLSSVKQKIKDPVFVQVDEKFLLVWLDYWIDQTVDENVLSRDRILSQRMGQWRV